MKLLILFYAAIVQISLIAQTPNYTFSKLTGMEDQYGNTHLFYWKYAYSGNDTNNSYQNNIFHLDLSNGEDTLFLQQYGYTMYFMSSFSHSIDDFEFWNNDPSKYIYTKTVCGFDCSAAIIRYDGNPDQMRFGFVGIGKVAISRQNDSTLYSSYQLLLKSTDGGRNWFIQDTSDKYLEFVSLSPFNDSVIFAVNLNLQLVKSTDGGITFSFSDNLGFPEYNNLPFYFDKDSIHIYRLDYQQKIYTSNNKGEANTWTKKYSSTNNLYLSIDDSVSGSVYLADGNKILESTDYGNTFNVYKTLDSSIVGIYKKPASDILYAATKYDIYEITPASIQSIKHLVVNVDNQKSNIPSEYILYQNYPNPFNPSTTIKYQIPKPGLVQLKVYDILGREVATLLNEYQTAGEHSVFFTTDNKQQTTNHKQLSSGIYFYQLKSGSFVSTKKLLLLK